MKRYEKYKDSGVEWIGEIPEHWEVKKLKYVMNSFDHQRVPISADQRNCEKIYDYYGASGVIDKVDDYLFDGEYILIGEDGANLLARSTPLAFKATGKFWVNNHAHVLKPKSGNIDFYTYLLESLDYTIWVTGSAQPKLTAENLLNIPIYELPINTQEQTIIANYLDEKTAQINNLIGNKQKLIDLLREERTAIINQAVTKGIDPNIKLKPSGIEWLGEIPEHWEVKKLKYVVELKSGESITANNIRQEGEFPVYGGNGLRGFTSEYSHEGDFILIGRQGALCGNINYAQGKFWASEHAVVVSKFNKENIIWLGELLRVMNLNQYSMSAAQPGLSVERIQNLFIPYPQIEEQQRIGNYIETQNQRIEGTIIRIGKEIDLLQEYRTVLISEVVTGKIKVV